MADDNNLDLSQLTVQLLSAYLANNVVAREDLADLIATTRHALSGEIRPVADPTPEFVPAVSVRKSLASPDHIISLVDGRPYKTLKRHLARHGLTPSEYRARYSLPKDYPMVAKAYSEQRRATAARIGLGNRSKPGPIPPESAAAAPTGAPSVKPSTAPKASKARKTLRIKVGNQAEAKPGATSKAAATRTASEKAPVPSPRKSRKKAVSDTAEQVPPSLDPASNAAPVNSPPEKTRRAPAKASVLKSTEGAQAEILEATPPSTSKRKPGRPRKAKDAPAV